jgi:hypothetical protein
LTEYRHVNVPIRFVTALGWVVLMPGFDSADEPEARFRVITRKADDRVITRISGNHVIFTIISPTGIGGATITRVGERWSEVIDLRLRLRGMERLQVSNGMVTFCASVASSADHRTMLWLSQGAGKDVPVDRGSPYWTEIRILDDEGEPAQDTPLKDGVFAITLPQALFAASPSQITLDWIDFFR